MYSKVSTELFGTIDGIQIKQCFLNFVQMSVQLSLTGLESNPTPFYLNLLLILNRTANNVLKKPIFDYQWMTKMHLRVSVVELQYGRPPDIDPASRKSTHSF